MAHNGSCANAIGHTCECTGCAGTLHGWIGWLDLAQAAASTAVDDRHEAVHRKLVKNRRPRARQSNQRWLEAALDLARVDLVRWIRRQRLDPDSGPAAWPDLRVAGGSGQERPPRPGAPNYPMPDEQVEKIAKQVVVGTWRLVAADVDAAARNPGAVRRELANHFWCDLLIGLAEAVERWQGPLEKIPIESKRWVTAAVSGSEHSSLRRHVTGRIVEILVDKVWDMFTAALFGHFTMLAVLSSEDLRRSLRMLAVFACPAPVRHAEVRELALKPLGEELHGALGQETRDELRMLFAEWRGEGDDSGQRVPALR